MPNNSEHCESRDEDIQVISDAEFYLLVGEELRRGPTDGRSLAISPSIPLPPYDIIRARRFAKSPNAFILRALVEEWPWPRIKTGLDELEAVSPCDERPS